MHNAKACYAVRDIATDCESIGIRRESPDRFAGGRKNRIVPLEVLVHFAFLQKWFEVPSQTQVPSSRSIPDAENKFSFAGSARAFEAE
jgi:hypothetical protein